MRVCEIVIVSASKRKRNRGFTVGFTQKLEHGVVERMKKGSLKRRVCCSERERLVVCVCVCAIACE